MSEYADKLRSLGFPRRLGQTEQRQTVADGRLVATEAEHWDGRKDATVFPDVVRYGARTHGTGKRRGEVAEVRELDKRERRDRYGEG